MIDHYWDESLGMFVPSDLESTDGIDPTPFGSDHPRNQSSHHRELNSSKLESLREDQYEKWREEVRQELIDCGGDPIKESQVRSKYSNYDRGYTSPSSRSSPSTDPNKKGHVYVIQDKRSGLFKIGRTTDMNRRMKELGVGKTSRLIQSKEVENAPRVEKEAHSKYKNSRLPQSEYFNLDTPPSI
jgi:hypothetical protein